MSLYILMNSLIYVLFWNVMLLVGSEKLSMTTILISVVTVFAPSLIVGSFTETGELFKRALVGYSKENGFIIFSSISALPVALLCLYFGVAGKTLLGTIICGVGLCANTVLIALCQLIIWLRMKRGEESEYQSECK